MDEKPNVSPPLDKEDRKELSNYWKNNEVVKVLIIAEAPPDDHKKYFYNHETNVGHGLFSYVTCALDIREKTKEERLERLRENYIWMIDIFSDPIEEITNSEIVEENLEDFRSELKQITPKKKLEKIIIAPPKSRIKGPWKQLISYCFFNDYRFDDIIYIPSWTRENFKEKLEEIKQKYVEK